MNYDSTMIEGGGCGGGVGGGGLPKGRLEAIERACGEFFSDDCSAEAEAAGITGIHSILTRGVDTSVEPTALARLMAHMYEICDQAERMHRFSQVALGWVLENHPEAVEYESEDVVESGDEETQKFDVARLIQEGGKIHSITVSFAEMPEVVA